MGKSWEQGLLLTQSLQLENFASSKVQTQPASVNRSVFNKNSVISQK